MKVGADDAAGQSPVRFTPAQAARFNFNLAVRRSILYFALVNFILNSALCVSVGVRPRARF